MILITFIIAILSFSIQANPSYVFDLSGSFQGFGDVVGVWSAFYGIQKSKPKANYIAIIDSRAKEVLQDMYKKSLNDISKQFHVQFYPDTDLERVPKADIYFQLFFGGRRIKTYDNSDGKEVYFFNPVFCTAQSVVVVSDTMHGHTLDEAFGSSFHFYFSPPGIGSKRSGILNSTDLDRLVNMAPIQQQEFAASLFSGKAIQDLILQKGSYHNVKLSFIYGSHNETFNKSLMGQTKDYIHALESYNADSPVVIFSPHKLEKLQEVLPGFKRILTLQEFEKQPKLENKVYVLQLPPVTNLQFSALISIADLPVLLEGNNAISQAIRLQKEFLVMRSPWNAPQIEDLISVDSALGGPWIYPGVYDLSREVKPYFESYFHYYNTTGNWHKRFFQKYALSESIPDFVGKLIQVINLSEIMKDKPVSKDKLLATLKGIEDPYLVYSVALTAQKKHVISLEEVSTIREDLKKKGFMWKEAEKRFTPNKPGFSRKIEVIGMGID